MRPLVLAFVLLVPLVGTACEDPFGPRDWPPGAASPDTVELFSLGRLELLGLPSAFDFTPENFGRVVVEEPGYTGRWDVAVTDQAGQLVFMPPGVLPGVETTAAIATDIATPFDQLQRAPRGAGVFNDSTTVPIREGAVYVIRTRQVRTFLGNCFYYAKVEALRVDFASGSFLFRYIANPNCNDPALVPPDAD